MFGVGPIGCLSQLQLCGVSEHPANFYYIDIPGLATSTPGPATLLLETDTGASDLFTSEVPQGATFQYHVLVFSSDTEIPVGFRGNFILIPEGNGGPYDATQYLATSFIDAGFTATFLSDPVEAPEPTYGLAMCGALALGLRRRHSRMV